MTKEMKRLPMRIGEEICRLIFQTLTNKEFPEEARRLLKVKLDAVGGVAQ